MNTIKQYLLSLQQENNITDLNDIEILVKKHASELSFTSIPVLLKKELSLELSMIIEKIVEKKEGGYCFEHNKLLFEALKYSGFDVKSLLGRVIKNKDITPPKTHRFILLNYEDERYIVDVGFGYMSPSKPIKFGDVPTTTHLGIKYRVKEHENEIFSLEVVLDEDFYTLYQFDLKTCYEVDFELSHFYSHRHKSATFVNNFVLSCILEEEVRSIRNSSYHKIFADYTKKINIESSEQLQEILKLEFSYPISVDEVQYIYNNFVRTK